MRCSHTDVPLKKMCYGIAVAVIKYDKSEDHQTHTQNMTHW